MIFNKEGEKILSVYRRHKFIIIMELFPLALFAIITVALAFFIVSMFFSEMPMLYPVVFLIMFLFLHLFWIASFIALADYYLDIWILTDKRVITVEQKSLFSRIISEFELSKIQEVSVGVHGFLPTVIDYGDVRVRTASENPNFVFKQVSNPNRIKDEITKAAEDNKKKISSHE